MKKKPFLLQILGDTLFFLPHLLDVPIPWPRKISILVTYVRLTFLQFLVAPFKGVHWAKALSFHINFFDYRVFHLLYRAMFIRNDYFFVAKNDFPLIIDCGANIGFATFYFKWLYPASEIHAFEPEPLTFHLLQKNISENNFINVVCHSAAVTNVDGEADFYFDKYKPGSIQMSLMPRNFRDTVRVRTMALSTYIQDVVGDREIDFLKLDLEGAELKAMQDLVHSRRLRQAREIFVEYHHRLGDSPSAFGEFLKLFEENGFEYSIDTYYTNRYSEDKFQCINIFATRKDDI